MAKFRDILLGILVGVMLGLVLGWGVTHYATAKSCPASASNCIDKALITPVSDRGYYLKTHQILQNSKESIHMVMFEVKYYPKYPNSHENILVRDLIEAKKRGVDVKIIVDEYSNKDNAYDYLKKNGVEIKYDPENITTHSKVIIVDGKIIILGSTNWSYFSLDNNHETDIVIEDSETAEYFENYFQWLWE